MAQGRFADLYDNLMRVEKIVEGLDEPMTRTALRYLLSDNRVSMLLCGVSGIDELEDCVGVSDGGRLSRELIAEIEGR